MIDGGAAPSLRASRQATTMALALALLGASCSARRGLGPADLALDLAAPAHAPSGDLAVSPVALPDGGSCYPAGAGVPEEWTSWYCCSHAEVNGACCQTANGACSGGAPCCSGSCVGGSCACSALAAICGSDGDCCDGAACSYAHNNGPNATCCARPGHACTRDGECCGACVSGRCAPVGPDQACRGDADCTSRHCGSDGRCAQNGLGGFCASASDCASGGCKHGVCACTPAGGPYDVDAPCCSGHYVAPACQ